MRNDRIDWIDTLKGVLIVFVILSHSYPAQIYRNFFSPFFLTMFFWVAGYTFSTKGSWKDFLKSKCIRLLTPFLVLGSIRIILAQILGGGNFYLRIKGLLIQVNGYYDEMWFVACLFTASMLFRPILTMCHSLEKKYQHILVLAISGIGLVIGMLDMCLWQIHILWQVELALAMCFYMSLGYLYKQYEKQIADKLEKFGYLGSLCLGYIFLVVFFPNNVDIHMEKFERPFLFLILSWICILPIVGMVKKITQYKYLKRIFIFWGQNTLFYYAFGGSIRIILYKLFGLENSTDVYLLPVICTLLTMIVLIIPAWLVKRFFPWMVGAGRKNLKKI